MRSDEGPAQLLVEYSVGAVARRLGVPVATLRSWNQRYGLGPSQRRRGRHRRYTPTDFAVAVRMVDLVRAGASPASAAVAARAVAVPVPQLGDLASVISAAERLAAAELLAIITAHLTHHGVVATWNRLCRPAFAEIVGKQGGGTGFVDVEHLLSWAVTTSLHRLIPLLRNVSEGPPIVLACTDGENHVLPLEVLRAALAELGLPALLLGASVPAAALADALAKHDRRPVVVLWSQSSRTAIAVPAFGPRESWARVLLAGPGWRECAAPSAAVRVDTLEAAIAELQTAVASNLR
ncbi:MerR family transcriptional regulator [Nocardia sp. KC 131]|uniref:MerR family transcriptional regulator n=1 Tax=Nocardia arseniciresistens TaxID=3392119 RepID=UPI00398EBC3C